MYILLNIKDWKFNLCSDISAINRLTGLSTRKINTCIRDHSGFIDQYYITNQEPIKSKRGRK